MSLVVLAWVLLMAWLAAVEVNELIPHCTACCHTQQRLLHLMHKSAQIRTEMEPDPADLDCGHLVTSRALGRLLNRRAAHLLLG